MLTMLFSLPLCSSLSCNPAAATFAHAGASRDRAGCSGCEQPSQRPEEFVVHLRALG